MWFCEFQEFVELIRQDRRLDAVMHARKVFAAFQHEQMIEIRQCMGLLAFPITTGKLISIFFVGKN